MGFYGSCFIGKIAHLLHPTVFFQKATDLLHSTQASCFTPILIIKMFFPPINIWRGFVLVIHFIIWAPKVKKASIHSNPFGTLICFCVYLRKLCIFEIHSSQGRVSLDLSFSTWETTALCVCLLCPFYYILCNLLHSVEENIGNSS